MDRAGIERYLLVAWEFCSILFVSDYLPRTIDKLLFKARENVLVKVIAYTSRAYLRHPQSYSLHCLCHCLLLELSHHSISTISLHLTLELRYLPQSHDPPLPNQHAYISAASPPKSPSLGPSRTICGPDLLRCHQQSRLPAKT
jgi:hypothetical protein